MQNEEHGAKPITEFYLMGLRLDGRREIPDFYTFLLEQENRLHPLIAEGQLILFARPDLAADALRLAGIEVEFRRPLSLDNVHMVDVAGALYLLAHESADPQQKIANVLDLFARILRALGVPLPPVFDVLVALGKHVDQNEFYGDFLAREEFLREKAIDGTRWCLGAIFSLARILTT